METNKAMALFFVKLLANTPTAVYTAPKKINPI